jgi:ABC-type transporter Mla MlaB component
VAVTFDRSAVPGTIRLEGEVDIAGAAELKRVLLEALGSAQETRVAVERATCVDVTAAQLLWAAQREAQAAGMVLTLEGTVPEKLRAGLRDAGFERFPIADPLPHEVRA